MNAGLIDFGRIAAICSCGYLCMLVGPEDDVSWGASVGMQVL